MKTELNGIGSWSGLKYYETFDLDPAKTEDTLQRIR